MAAQSLASRYRPQRFVDVVGQHTTTAALSRVCAEGAPAAAYLLSGTRGVGKTTIARIFAKGLNCANGPGPEPCNECLQCRQITEGSHVDVCEIDAASNTGVDDVRALRENLGFMPMNGRFKIFIVDEAHMLSKSAFNALLKTLEEPPANTVFIFATTEAHRFPATIISRCQHYIFRHLPKERIQEHLLKVLKAEGAEFEDAALELIARRAAGSVRDSLSLLDQAIAIGGAPLTGKSVRESLGLAGPEFYSRCFKSISAGDVPGLVSLANELLGTGVDIGFFLRELINYLRGLFLVSQTGEKILPGLRVSADEEIFLKNHAALFGSAHLHAAWQMALQSQRGIMQSPEPGPGLELLLVNLALLPKLLPIEKAPLPATPLAEAGEAAPRIIAEETAPYNAAPAEAENQTESVQKERGERTWEGFCEFCRKLSADEAPGMDILRPLEARWETGCLTLKAASRQLWDRLQKNRRLLLSALNLYCGGNPPEVEFQEPPPRKGRKEMLEDCANNPQVQLCQEILGARIADCYQKGDNHAQHE